MTGAARLALLAPLWLAVPAAAGPQGPAERGDPGAWRFTGDFTGRLEDYEVSGDALQSPYRFTGFEPYAELSLGAERRLGAWRKLRAQFLGLVADNDYRTDHDGVVVERASLSLEDGSGRLPYRLEVGDTYAYFSQRTVQRSLKGLQLELQGPLTGAWRHSFQLVTGFHHRNWRELDHDGDFTAGASWLIDAPSQGRLSLSYVDNRRDETRFLFRTDQRLFSVAAQAFLADRRLSLEGEVDHLREDARSSSGEEDVHSDQGWLVQAQNGPRPSRLLYRLRYERYGEGYRPAGAPIIANRRTREGHVGWRFPSGLELRARLQDYRDSLESPNPLDATTVGLSLRGAFLRRWVSGVSGTLDFFVQGLDDRSGASDTRAATFVADLVKSIRGVWTPRLHYFFQDSNDRTPIANDQTIHELRLGFDRAIGAAGFTGAVGPGLLLRWLDKGIRQGSSSYPTLGLNLARGPHSLRQDLGFETLDRDLVAVGDVGTFSYHMLYRYAMRRDDLGLEFDSVNRSPDPGAGTDSYRIAAYWSHHFQFQAAGPRPAPSGDGGRTGTQALEGTGPLDLAELAPGARYDQVLARLQRAGVTDQVRLGNLDSYVTTLLSEVPQRQRLLLIQRDDTLDRAALVIDADEFSSDADFLVSFERVRQILLGRYGAPSNLYEDGPSPTDLAAAVDSGSFVRLTEWSRPQGVLRFGIPRRLDGRLTMELQYAVRLPAVTDARWSITDARR